MLGDNLHHFVSAAPWIRDIDRQSVRIFLNDLGQLNPGVAFGLLEIEQIDRLNAMGFSVGFKIENCWTCSICDDWQGRIDGHYLLSGGLTQLDYGKSKTDVYVVFGFVPGKEKSIVMPE